MRRKRTKINQNDDTENGVQRKRYFLGLILHIYLNLKITRKFLFLTNFYIIILYS